MLRQVHAAQQQQVLEFADAQEALLVGGRRRETTRWRPRLGLARIAADDLGHVAQPDHRPVRGALRPKPQLGRAGAARADRAPSSPGPPSGKLPDTRARSWIVVLFIVRSRKRLSQSFVR